METVNIKRRICINPEFLGKEIHSDIFKFIKENTKDECTKENGYIIEVHKLKRIIENYISGNNGELIFEVDVLVERIKPEINKVFSDKVCMVFNQGIFVDVSGKFKILIPLSSLKDFEFDPSNKIFKNSKTEIVIKEGDVISVKVTGIKFVKNNFKCFGDIIIEKQKEEKNLKTKKKKEKHGL
jgi:DNA-directed RNA polymerase subunit E'/Rpb7